MLVPGLPPEHRGSGDWPGVVSDAVFLTIRLAASILWRGGTLSRAPTMDRLERRRKKEKSKVCGWEGMVKGGTFALRLKVN